MHRHQISAAGGPLSPQQVTEFRESGFLVIETPQLQAPEIEWCKRVLTNLLERGKGREEGRYFDLTARNGGTDGPSPQLLSPSLYATELRGLSYRKPALALAKQLLGDRASFSGDQVIFKPSRQGGPTPWHQDEAFRDPGFEYNELSIWIALTDSTNDNGAMAYIPKSHLAGVLPHRLYGGSTQANTLECCSGFDPSSAAVRPVKAGALIIHHGCTVHGAAANNSNFSRMAYVLSYLTPPVKRKEPRDFPWLEELRRATRRERNKTLLRGGALPELVRILRSDRYADRHFLSGFLRRRVKQLRRMLRL